MANDNLPTVAHFLRRMLSPVQAAGLTDDQLLERFLSQRDEAAFEVLVWRHGPKVLGVCRRVLGQAADIEDAFQATFLVLVRKAASIGKREAIGSWIYRVAYHVALRAKISADKRTARQTQFTDIAVAQSEPDLISAELRAVLDEEVSRLPEKFRAPFILCHVDGRTNEEAARELGCPKGTVLSRLSAARQRLRARLTRRGVALGTVLVGESMLLTAPAACLHHALVQATLRTALFVALGKSAADFGSIQATTLAKGVLHAMFWNKVKIVTGCLIAMSAFALTGGAAWQVLDAREESSQPVIFEQEKKKARQETEVPRKQEEKTFVFEMRDKSWASVFEWYSNISGLPYIGTLKPTGTVSFVPPRGGRRYSLVEITDLLNELLMAQKFILIRRDTNFTVLPTDEKIDPTFIPRVTLDTLSKRGRTELVIVVLPPTSLSAKDLGPTIQKLIGPLGEMKILERQNRILVLDTAGNLQLIQQTIKDIEESVKKEEFRRK